jgi:hypothetical protein
VANRWSHPAWRVAVFHVVSGTSVLRYAQLTAAPDRQSTRAA